MIINTQFPVWKNTFRRTLLDLDVRPQALDIRQEVTGNTGTGHLKTNTGPTRPHANTQHANAPTLRRHCAETRKIKQK